MLLRILRFVGVGTASIALANLAGAAEVTTDATSAKLGGEFRADWTQTDNGLWKSDGFTPPSTSETAVHEANLLLSGKINAKTEYHFELSLLGRGMVEGYGKHWFSKMVGFSIGRQRVLQGGWDQEHNDYYRVATSHLISGNGLLPFGTYEDMIGVHIMAGGELTLQLVNDVTTEAGRRPGAYFNKNAHPTFILGWKGDFNGIMPKVNIGAFDNQKSNYFDVGIATSIAGLTASLDFHQQTRAYQYADGADMADASDVTTAFSLWAGYAIKGTATPWLYYANHEVKQSEDAGGDAEFNSVDMTNPANPTMSWADNGTTLGIGVNLHMMGDNFEPYLAIVQQSGDFDDGAGEAESKSEMQIKLGVSSKI